MTSTSDADDMADDRGCLRVVLAVPLTLLSLVAAYCCWWALTIEPGGSWDDDAYLGIELACLLTIGAAAATVALWVLPPVRRIMPWWWVAPAVLLAVVAGVRLVTGGAT